MHTSVLTASIFSLILGARYSTGLFTIAHNLRRVEVQVLILLRAYDEPFRVLK